MYGEAYIIKIGNGIQYRESTDLHLDTGFSTNTYQQFYFEKFHSAIGVYFDTPMRHRTLFCTIAKKPCGKEWHGIHRCGQDMYYISYILQNKYLVKTKCVITGPRKNHKILTYLTRTLL